MITNTGKSIIGKYLLGQAPAYASYIAVGCGPKPLITGDPLGSFSTKKNLDFEMFRVPISSRGFVNEGGLDKIVLTAELPTEERYEITEVGIYSAGSNPSAGSYDSKTILGFTQSENWQYHSTTATESISTYLNALDASLYDNVIAITDPVFQTNSDNVMFYKPSRALRFERPRFLNNTILIQGDTANLTTSAGHFVINSGSEHIHLTGTTVDLSKNAPTDELRFGFSLINKDGEAVTIPDTVRVLIDFSSTDETSGEFARFEAEINEGIDDVSFADNRYYIVSKQLQDLYTTANFTWNTVSVVKIYVSVIDGGTPSDQYYVALDAVRLENIATTNPLYGLVGYSVIQTDDGATIEKRTNTSNYIEFRFSIGVS